MFLAKQLKTKVVSEDGGHLFSIDKPPAGHLIVKTPGKLPLKRLVLTMQDQTITLAENSTILKSGETLYHFAFEVPLKPEGLYKNELYDEVLSVRLFPDFSSFNMDEELAKKSFKASHYTFHQLQAWFQISTLNTRYVMSEASFVFAQKTIWPFALMIIVYMAIVLIAGLEWFFLLPILALLVICERRITHNSYFAGLENRVFMNEESDTFLEIIPRNGITKFLEATVRFSIEEFRITNLTMQGDLRLDKTEKVSENVSRFPDRYLISLPIPKSGYPAGSRLVMGEGVVWKLQLRYPRILLPDLKYSLEIQPEYLAGK
ncbi:MAG: hypothetical protein AB8H12_21890 [Lewinella sp.]